MKVKFLTIRPFGEKVKQWLISQGETIVEKGQDITVVCYYDKILSDKELQVPAVNFHPGLLPLNRGMHPQIWPLVDGSPAGVTLHWVTKEIDCGNIIAQEKINVDPTDIVSDMDRKTQKALFDLFKRNWKKIKRFEAGKSQEGPSSRHYKKDIQSLHEFDKGFIGRLRACTYDDTSYGYFIDNGKKIKVGVKFYL